MKAPPSILMQALDADPRSPVSACTPVQDACAAFFSDQLRSRETAAWAATQVPRIWAWAEFASRDALARDCREFACRQFPEVARSSGAVVPPCGRLFLDRPLETCKAARSPSSRWHVL